MIKPFTSWLLPAKDRRTRIIPLALGTSLASTLLLAISVPPLSVSRPVAAEPQPGNRVPRWTPEAKEFFERGLAATRQRQWQSAINLFLKANWLADVDVAPIVFNLGLAHAKSGGEIAAVCYFNMYLALEPQSDKATILRTEIDLLRKEQKIKTQKVLDHAIQYVEKTGMNYLDVWALTRLARDMGERPKVAEIERRYGKPVGESNPRVDEPIRALQPADIWRRNKHDPDDSGCEHLVFSAGLPRRWAPSAATNDLINGGLCMASDDVSVVCYPGNSDLALEQTLRFAASIGNGNIWGIPHSYYIGTVVDIAEALDLDTHTMDALALGTPDAAMPNPSVPIDPKSLDNGWVAQEANDNGCRVRLRRYSLSGAPDRWDTSTLSGLMTYVRRC